MTGTTTILSAVGSGLVVALAGAEIALRASAQSLPVRDWWNWETENKARAMDRLAKRGGASVVVVGSSMIQTAADPALLSDLLGTTRPVFNAALNGANARTLEPWTREIVVPRLRPDVVLFGVDSLELNDNSLLAPQIYARFVNSRPWRRMKGEGRFRSRVVYRLERASYLVRYARFFRTSTRRTAGEKRALSKVTDLGYLVMADIFRERPYHAKERQIEVWHQALNEYTVGGHELVALERLVDGLRASGIRVVIVNMPVTEDWIALHPNGAEDFARYERAVSETLSERDVPLIDLMPRFTSADHFADPVHMNGLGQEVFTRLLADILFDAAAVPADRR